jgi:tetratricopeptide (TPR) repeat protein
MFDLAVREDDWARADTLIRRKFPERLPYDVRVVFAVFRKDTASLRLLRAEGQKNAGQKGRRGDLALEAGWLLATYLEDLEPAEEFTRYSTRSSLPVRIRAPAHVVLAELGVAGGRWSAAKRELAAAARLGQVDSALIGRALTASLPFLGVPRDEVRMIRDEVERWRPGRDASKPLPESIRPLAPHLRLYLLGLLSTRLGAGADALRLASEIETLPASPQSRPVTRSLARTIRADVAAESGRTSEGLTLLEDVRGDIPFELLRLPYFSEEHARYLRSRLLFQAGRDEEALRLVENAFEGTPSELYYLAPAHLLQAEIQQRLGNREAAAEEYSRFIALWRSCDPPLRPIVENARTQLARMVGEPRQPSAVSP